MKISSIAGRSIFTAIFLGYAFVSFSVIAAGFVGGLFILAKISRAIFNA